MEVNLEQEQESLFNSLSKRVDHLEAEKRHLFYMVNNPGGEAPPQPPLGGSISPHIEYVLNMFKNVFFLFSISER